MARQDPPPVPRRTLGAQGLEVSAMGLGCMGMSFAYGQADEARSLATLDRALERGVTLWDTADIYGPRTNEELLAQALSGRRDRVEVATKFGAFSLEDRDRGQDGRQGPLPGAVRGRAGHRPAGARDAPDHRAAVGVLAVDAGPRGRGSADRARAGRRVRALQPPQQR